jgi:hypothetical protein
VTYDRVRLVLAAIGILPPLAFVCLMAPSSARMRPLPSWLTWGQSLALVALYGGVIGASAEALAFGWLIPSLPVQLLLFSAYGGLAAIRYTLLVWWIRDRRRP